MNDSDKQIQETEIKQAIENIEITPEQEDRIYQNIENHSEPIKHKIRLAKILTPIAACIAVLVVMGTVWANFGGLKKSEDSENPALYNTYKGFDESGDSELCWEKSADSEIKGEDERADIAGYGGESVEGYEYDSAKEYIAESPIVFADGGGEGAPSYYPGEEETPPPPEMPTNDYVNPQAGLLRGASIDDHADVDHFMEYVKDMSGTGESANNQYSSSTSFWKLFPDYSGDYSYKSETKKTSLDLMFTIDTTGSMGDELSYIQAELSDVISRVRKDNAQIPINLSCNFYRDEGDEYVVRSYPFSSNIEEGLKILNAQNIDGGGDTPEAVEQALNDAIFNHGWRSDDNVAKLLFLVLDAPPHSKDGIKSEVIRCVEKAREMGIIILPVAASGVDTDTEFLLRQIAYYTGGTYQFLVDNYYGIGGEHTTPKDKEYEEKNFNDLMVDIINSYLA